MSGANGSRQMNALQEITNAINGMEHNRFSLYDNVPVNNFIDILQSSSDINWTLDGSKLQLLDTFDDTVKDTFEDNFVEPQRNTDITTQDLQDYINEIQQKSGCKLNLKKNSEFLKTEISAASNGKAKIKAWFNDMKAKLPQLQSQLTNTADDEDGFIVTYTVDNAEPNTSLISSIRRSSKYAKIVIRDKSRKIAHRVAKFLNHPQIDIPADDFEISVPTGWING